ncbi:hypothetical protein Ddc_21779 [Ditylenchus destructor]|nr:hypothetical protein Ddc_21779 [Ditylenchus destructor]
MVKRPAAITIAAPVTIFGEVDPIKWADQCQRRCAGHAGVEEAERQHEGGHEGDDQLVVEAFAIRLEDDENADEADKNGAPASPAHMFSQQRRGQCRNDQRRGGEDGMAVRQPDDGEGEDGKNDLHRKQHATADLQPGAVGHDGTANAAGRSCSHQQNEDGKSPVSQHGDEDRRIGAAQMLRNAILRRKDRESDKRINKAGPG